MWRRTLKTLKSKKEGEEEIPRARRRSWRWECRRGRCRTWRLRCCASSAWACNKGHLSCSTPSCGNLPLLDDDLLQLLPFSSSSTDSFSIAERKRRTIARVLIGKREKARVLIKRREKPGFREPGGVEIEGTEKEKRGLGFYLSYLFFNLILLPQTPNSKLVRKKVPHPQGFTRIYRIESIFYLIYK